MRNTITCSMLESTSTFDYDKIDNGVSKSTVLEPTMKNLTKETNLGCVAAQILVSRGQNKREEIPLMEKFTLK